MNDCCLASKLILYLISSMSYKKLNDIFLDERTISFMNAFRSGKNRDFNSFSICS